MNLKEYLQKAMPRLQRSELKDGIEKLRGELDDIVMPAYDNANEYFGTRKFKAAWLVQFDKFFEKEFMVKYKGNFISGIATTLPLLRENLEAIIRLSDNTKEPSWSKDAVGLLSLNLIRSVEHMTFLATYARRLLNVALAMEVNVAEGQKEDHDISKHDIDWLNKNKNMFLGAYSILAMKRSDLEKRLKDTPNVVVGEDTADILTANMSKSQIDPLGLNLIPIPINPFWAIGKRWAERQANRYNSALAERDSIQLRLQYLRQLEAEGKGDGLLRSEIEITQGRVDKLNYDIKEMEESWLSN